MSQWNVRRYEKEHLKPIFGGSGEGKTVLDDRMEVLVNGRDACDAAVGQCVWQALGKNGEEKIKKKSTQSLCGYGQLYGRFGQRGAEERFTLWQCQECRCGILGFSSLKMHFGFCHMGTPNSDNLEAVSSPPLSLLSDGPLPSPPNPSAFLILYAETFNFPLFMGLKFTPDPRPYIRIQQGLWKKQRSHFIGLLRK